MIPNTETRGEKLVKIAYPNLDAEIKKRGVKRIAIATALEISRPALQHKLQGKVPFSFPQAQTLRDRFFPDLSLDYLFDRSGTSTTSDK